MQGRDGTTGESVSGRISELAAAQAAKLGLVVLEVEVTATRPPLVRVIVDLDAGDEGRIEPGAASPESVDVDVIAALSRALGAELEAADVLDDDLTLEVSSPGVDRPLTSPRDLVRNLGRDVEVHLTDGDPGGTPTRGTLVAVEGGMVVLRTAGREQRFETAHVSHALAVLPW